MAIRALRDFRDEADVRHWALFLLANLSSGSAECKAAVGEAGGPAALAAIVNHFKSSPQAPRLGTWRSAFSRPLAPPVDSSTIPPSPPPSSIHSAVRTAPAATSTL